MLMSKDAVLKEPSMLHRSNHSARHANQQRIFTLNDTLSRAYPTTDCACFDELLRAIDVADARRPAILCAARRG